MTAFYGDQLVAYTPISVDTVKSKLDVDTPVIDVRGASEFNENHIPGAKNVFVGTLKDNFEDIPKNKEVIIHCQSGDRSSLAYSLLRRAGYNNVLNYAAGMKEWTEVESAAIV
jgi:hydroxyacylglutathione hydrolase